MENSSGKLLKKIVVKASFLDKELTDLRQHPESSTSEFLPYL